MIRLLLLFIFLTISYSAQAQNNILEHLQKDNKQGKVRIFQSEQISQLVLGERLTKTTTISDLLKEEEPTTTNANPAIPQRTIKRAGYRVQVYVGNNSRRAREEANAVGARVKMAHPELRIYTTFQSPRWLCRVGDFHSYEEAHLKAQELRRISGFKEVAVVKDQINVPLD